METTLIALLAVITLAALIAVPTTYVRMRRRLELANKTHTQKLTNLELDHDDRLARLKRDAEQSQRYAHHQLAKEILPVIDALDEACKFASSNPQNTSSDGIHHGVTLAKKQLLQALERQGIEYISPHPGDTFDPTSHEAVHLAENETLQSGQIAHCLRAGFRQEDRVLRSAMVEVVSNPSQPTPPPEEVPSNDNASPDNLTNSD